jgi:ATP-dependent exoDNAse (exonuclease V) beta subunit
MTLRITLSDDRDRLLIRETALDETLVVEAAAGTGKTTELVARVVQVLATGRAQISQIVAVTFTEKAAGELKLRLREAVENARRQATGAAGGRLDAALRKLEEAHISTIHGFCADLLRERPVEAGLDPLFQVLTEPQADRLFTSVFERWLQDQLADPPDGIRRVLRRRSSRMDDEGSVESLRRAGLELAAWRDFDAEWTRPDFDRTERIDRLFDEARAAADLLRDPSTRYDPLHQTAWPIRRLVDDVVRVEQVLPRRSAERAKAGAARDYDGLEAELVALSRHRELPKLQKGKGAQYKAGVARDEVWQAIDRLRASLNAFEMDADADLAALLQRELQPLAHRYARAKANAGVVDFLDLLLQARDLIRDNREVRANFQKRFTRIFVDEFQDTDPLQAEILLLLSSDDSSVSRWRTVRTVPGKLFLVGDPKQSIYRFRRADVGVYRSVYEQLEKTGARRVTLRASFRARPNIQRAINAAFAPLMGGDELTQQPQYVGLEPVRTDADGQPSLVVLPVPEPYAIQRIAAVAIDQSIPDAVGAFVEWLVRQSGWTVEVRGTDGQPRQARIQAGHICVLFRRFVSFDRDVTRPYVEALEARGIPHLLVGGRSFHNRAEVEALRAALGAIERPDDELSVFATLRGPFFGIGDEDLLRFRHQYGRFHPFHVPLDLDPQAMDEQVAPLRPIGEALTLLRSLHDQRNRVAVAATIGALVEATRVHVRFALEQGGEQILANVLRVADLARQYEAEGGISFRGFLEALDEQADNGQVEEAPILEEGSDGVRLMTVHKAKGLEFPVVILADMTAKLRPAVASRYLDGDRLCAIRLAGCVPDNLRRQGLMEIERDTAEGVRVAYVAATRARDLLVVPAVGDEEREGWIDPLNAAIFPPIDRRRSPAAAVGCPAFRSKDSVLERPNADPATAATVSPGLHHMGQHDVVWWDPRQLHLHASPVAGLRHEELIVKKDVPPEVIQAGLSAYNSWRAERARAIDIGSQPGFLVQTVTDRARIPEPPSGAPPPDLIRVDSTVTRPRGRRFGTLVHTVLASAPFDASRTEIGELAVSHGRALGASQQEVDTAAERVVAAFAHPLIARARDAWTAGRCRREVPVVWRSPENSLIEGVVDLAFEETAGWTVVDFKTDENAELKIATHHRQIDLYSAAIREATGKPVSGVLLYL